MATVKTVEEELKQPSETDLGTDEDFPRVLLKHPDVDRGWAYPALLSSFSVMVLIGLCMPLAGFMYVHHLEIFEKTPAVTACIGALMTALMNICGPVSSWISSRWSRRLCVIAGGLIVCVSLAVSAMVYNFWLILVTNGLLAGFGLGLVATATHVNIGCYFVMKRTIASGICVMGFPVGVFLCPPIIQYLEIVYGWRGAMLFFAGIQLNLCIMGVIMQPSPIEIYHKRQKIDFSENENENKIPEKLTVLKNKSRGKSVFKNIPFYFLSLAFLFSNFSINILYVHLPRFMYTRGGTAGDIQMMYLLLGSAGVISKLLTGLGTGDVKNGESLDKISLLLGSLSIVGTTLLVFPLLAHIKSYRFLCMFIVGLYYNVESVMYVPISIETVGFVNLSNAIGLILLFKGFGYFGGPSLAAFVVSATDNYDNAFYMAAFVVSATDNYDNAFYMAGVVNFLAVLSITFMVLIRPSPETKPVLNTGLEKAAYVKCSTLTENETVI